MYTKGFPFLIVLVILTVSSGCDNVEWAGAQVALEPPPTPPPVVEPTDGGPDEEEVPLEPVRLGPLVYLVERGAGAEATLTPVAVVEDGGYASLPDPAETPDLVERFPIDRWEAGTEFIVFSQGVRAGIFTADGSSRVNGDACLVRPVGTGVLELRTEASGDDRFFALRRNDLDEAVPSPLSRHPGVEVTDELRNASLDAARTLITRLSVPWPHSVLDIRRRIDAFGDETGGRTVAASFVFGDDLEIGAPEPTAYALFLVTREGEEGFTPVFSWYQRQDSGGKAFPGFLAAHDLRGVGVPDLAIEVFGRDERGLAILGADDGEWSIVYRDACASEPAGSALRTHP